MAGRPITQYQEIYHPINVTLDDGSQASIGETLVLCPICHSHLVGLYGKQHLKSGIWQKFQCKNSLCPALAYLRKGKQFTLHTSAIFQEALAKHLSQLLTPLLRGETTQIALGHQFHRSPALITHLRQKVQTILNKHKVLEKLVLEAPLEDGISLDEMFLTIEGEHVFIIMGTCYRKKKVLGIKVSNSRDETQMRLLFDEAERNNGKLFSLISIDAWGGSIKMAKNLGRAITLVIHKHKSPYKNAVIWKIEYEGTKQIIHKIGVKTDFFKFRRKREYHYLKETEDLTKSPLKSRGRPKGVKNGQGKRKGKYQKKPQENQQKRGPKGIFTVFHQGKKGYAKIDPKKKQVILAKGGSTTVGAALNQVFQLFAKMTIQNNLSENKNSVVEHHVWLSGPKDLENVENRIRTFLFYLNNPRELQKLQISHRLRGDLVYHELQLGLYGAIFRSNYMYHQKLTKLEVTN